MENDINIKFGFFFGGGGHSNLKIKRVIVVPLILGVKMSDLVLPRPQGVSDLHDQHESYSGALESIKPD